MLKLWQHFVCCCLKHVCNRINFIGCREVRWHNVACQKDYKMEPAFYVISFFVFRNLLVLLWKTDCMTYFVCHIFCLFHVKLEIVNMANRQFRSCRSSYPHFCLNRDDTWIVCDLIGSGICPLLRELAAYVLFLRELFSHLAHFWLRDGSQASAPSGSGATSGEVACHFTLWGSQVELRSQNFRWVFPFSLTKICPLTQMSPF